MAAYCIVMLENEGKSDFPGGQIASQVPRVSGFILVYLTKP